MRTIPPDVDRKLQILGPWMTVDGILRVENLRAVYSAVASGGDPVAAVAGSLVDGARSVDGPYDRRVRRALAILSREGLIAWNAASAEWTAS